MIRHEGTPETNSLSTRDGRRDCCVVCALQTTEEQLAVVVLPSACTPSLAYQIPERNFRLVAHQLKIFAEVDLLQCHTALKRLEGACDFVVVEPKLCQFLQALSKSWVRP